MTKKRKNEVFSLNLLLFNSKIDYLEVNRQLEMVEKGEEEERERERERKKAYQNYMLNPRMFWTRGN